jgi:hypothetical protein
MGYLHINNLYKNKEILMFKECYAMEKIHGTSAHVSLHGVFDGDKKSLINVCVNIFAGGENHTNFCNLFNEKKLIDTFIRLSLNNITIYGEAYGGKQQGMKDTYGNKLKFVAFDIKIDDKWLGIPQAEYFCKEFGIEFVHWEIVPTEIELLDKLANAPSIQAKRNGILEDKLREGIILRPLIELTKNDGSRIICKHKNEKFKEREHQPKLTNNNEESDIKWLEQVNAIVEEWVTPMRLQHLLGKREKYSIENTGEILCEMVEDVLREAQGEILLLSNNKELICAIKRKTAQLYNQKLFNLNNQ